MTSARIATHATFTLLAVALTASTSFAAQAPSGPLESTTARPLWVDLDGDELPDLYSFARGRADVFLRNLGDGRFADATREAGLDANVSRTATVLDFDDDGVSDLLLVTAEGGLRLFQGQGEGSFADATRATGLHELAGVTHAAPVDFDGDGWEDLLLETETGMPVFVRGLEGLGFEPLSIEVAEAPVDPVVFGVESTTGLLEPALEPATDDASTRSVNGGRRAVGPTTPAGSLPTPGTAAMIMPSDPPGALWAETLQDETDPMSYIGASTTPTLGSLYPLSSDLFVDSTGHVGVGTTLPDAQLHVHGDAIVKHSLKTGGEVEVQDSLMVQDDVDVGAQLTVGGGATIQGFTQFSDDVNVLEDLSVAGNLSATSFSEDASFEGNLDLEADISVAGHLDASSANIGSLTVVGNASLPFVTGPVDMDGHISSTSTASFASTGTISGVRGAGAAGPTVGHLGAAGVTAFDGVTSANWLGYELGLVGISTGASSNDNYGVMGHSNWVAVRGEHAVAPTIDWAELGLAGVGLRASGSALAADFVGAVDVSGALDVSGAVGLTSSLTSTSQASFNGNTTIPAVDASGSNGPTGGYLGAQGVTDFDGVTSADWAGYELGVVGISTGGSVADNYGVLGHSNNVGVRGENAAAPASDYAELGLAGTGILADGSTWAGRFLGDVEMTEILDVGGRLSAETGLLITMGESTGYTPLVVNGASDTLNYVTIRSDIEASNKNFLSCWAGANPGNRTLRVNTGGTVYADGAFTGPADFAEMIRVSSGATTIEPGDVVVIDPHELRSVVRSETPNSTLVMGVYSTKPGFVGSERDWDAPDPDDAEGSISLARKDMADLYDEVPVAVVGIVPCKVSAEGGAILAGDLLVTSSTPGHAMRSDDPRAGTIVGKALEPLSTGKGLIRILVTLQ